MAGKELDRRAGAGRRRREALAEPVRKYMAVKYSRIIGLRLTFVKEYIL
jgi:hypothetical protein